MIRRDLVGCNENYGVGALYTARDALSEAAEFFSIGIFPDGAVLRVFNEVPVLQ